MEYTPGQIYESLKRSFGDVQSTNVKNYLKNEIMNSNKNILVNNQNLLSGENMKIKQNKNDSEKMSTNENENKKSSKTIDDSSTPAELYFQYEKHFSIYGTILPPNFSLFYSSQNAASLLSNLEVIDNKDTYNRNIFIIFIISIIFIIRNIFIFIFIFDNYFIFIIFVITIIVFIFTFCAILKN